MTTISPERPGPSRIRSIFAERRRPVVAVAALAAVAPFNIDLPDGGWTPIFLRPLLILTIAVGAWVWLLERRSHLAPGRMGVRRVELVVLVWLAAVWLSAASSATVSIGSAGALRMTAFGLVVLAVAGVVRDRADALAVVAAIGIGALAAIVLGFAVFATGGHGRLSEHLFGATTFLGPHQRFTRPWSHANVAGMALGASFAPVLLLTRWFGWRAVATATAVGGLAAALVLTYSRGAVLGGTIAVGVVLAMLRPVPRVALATAALVGVGVAALSPGWAARIEQPGLAAWYGVELEAPRFVDLVGDAPAVVELTIANMSTVTWESEGSDQVVISARWVSRDQRWIWGEHQWPLPADLAPGDSVLVELGVDPIVPMGGYDVWWDLLLDEEAYFEQFSGRRTISSAVVLASPVAPESVEPVELVPRAVGLDRPEIWRLAIEAFGDRPVLGIGPSHMGLYFDEQLGEEQFVPGHHAHSVPLEALATWGVVGAVPLFVLIGGALARSARRAVATRTDVAIVTLASLTAIVGHGLVDWPLIHSSTMIVAAVFVGLSWSPAWDADGS